MHCIIPYDFVTSFTYDFAFLSLTEPIVHCINRCSTGTDDLTNLPWSKTNDDRNWIKATNCWDESLRME